VLRFLTCAQCGVAAADRCHDVEVLLQREHHGERAADELLPCHPGRA